MGRLTGGSFMPLVLPVSPSECGNSGFLQPFDDPNKASMWFMSNPGSSHPDGTEYVVPLCKTGGGSFMFLDLDPDLDCGEEVMRPPSIQFDTFPVDINTDTGANCQTKVAEAIDDADLQGKVVMVPICDNDCITNSGSNAQYHVVRIAAFYLDFVSYVGSIDSNGHTEPCEQTTSPTYGTPLVPFVSGNGSDGCIAGWFVRYITSGPVGLPGRVQRRGDRRPADPVAGDDRCKLSPGQAPPRRLDHRLGPIPHPGYAQGQRFRSACKVAGPAWPIPTDSSPRSPLHVRTNARRDTAPAAPSRGQALVELALILPVFLVLFASALDLGRLYYSQITINNAAKEGALEASRNPTSFDSTKPCNATPTGSSAWSSTRRRVRSTRSRPGDVSLTCSPSPCPTTPQIGDTVTVSVTGEFTLVSPCSRLHRRPDGPDLGDVRGPARGRAAARSRRDARPDAHALPDGRADADAHAGPGATPTPDAHRHAEPTPTPDAGLRRPDRQRRRHGKPHRRASPRTGQVPGTLFTFTAPRLTRSPAAPSPTRGASVTAQAGRARSPPTTTTARAPGSPSNSP